MRTVFNAARLLGGWKGQHGPRGWAGASRARRAQNTSGGSYRLILHHQRFVDPRRDFGSREGLFQKIDVRLDLIRPGCIAKIPGHEEHRHVRVGALDLAAKLDASHARHHDIGENHINIRMLTVKSVEHL